MIGKISFTAFVLLSSAFFLSAQTTDVQEQKQEKKQEQKQVYSQKQLVRLGIADPFFEVYAFADKPYRTNYTGASDVLGAGFAENRRHRYSPHISGEYYYRVLPWLLVGGIVDFQITCWQREYYNDKNVLMGHTDENFYNLCILPSLRFHYFRREYCELYSAISFGLGINGGTEKDAWGRKTVCSFATQYTLLGVMAGKDHWWGFAELGGLISLRGMQYIYILNSELIKCGVAYRF